MRRVTFAAAALAALVAGTAVVVPHAQEPAAPGPPGGRGPGAGRGAAAPPDQAAVARGRQAFSQTCAACHGADGRGGAQLGTDLSRSPIASANDGGQQLAALLRTGRPERGMPPFSLSADDVLDLSAFFRSIAPPPGGRAGRGAIAAVVTGDATAGAAYFNAAGCTTCHSATGDLKGIGSRLSAASIQGRAVMPRGDGGYPRGFNSPPDPSEKPKTVTITLESGNTVTGTLLWITDFNVTLIDGTGVRRTVARNGPVPKVVVTDPLQWHIDHLKKLTDTNMRDLTAYLVTLK